MTQRQGIEAGKAFVRFGVEDAEFKKGLMAARERLQAFGKSVAAIGGGLAAAGAIGLTPFVAGLRTLATAGDGIDKASQRAGLAADEFQRLAFALEQSGGSAGDVEKLAKSIASASFQLQRGSSTYVEAAEALGVSLDAVTTGSTVDRINALANAYEAAGDKAIAFGALQVLAGRGAANIIPLANGGTDALRNLAAQFDRVNLGASGDVIRDAAEFADALNIVRTSIRSLLQTIGSTVSGPLASLAEPFALAVGAVKEFTDANRGLVAGFAALSAGAVVVGGIAVAFGGAAVALGAVAGLLAAGGPIVVGIGTALAAIPVAIAGIAAVAGAIGLLESRTKTLSNTAGIIGKEFSAIGPQLRAGFNALFDGLTSDIETFGKLVALALEKGILEASDRVTGGNILAGLFGIDATEEGRAARDAAIAAARAAIESARRGALRGASGGGGEPDFAGIGDGIRTFNRGTFDSNPRLGAFERSDIGKQIVTAVREAGAQAKRAADAIEEGRFDDPAGVGGGVFR